MPSATKQLTVEIIKAAYIKAGPPRISIPIREFPGFMRPWIPVGNNREFLNFREIPSGIWSNRKF